jgi:hypothetical protein
MHLSAATVPCSVWDPIENTETASDEDTGPSPRAYSCPEAILGEIRNRWSLGSRSESRLPVTLDVT